MINNEELNNIVTNSRIAGYDVKVRDVCFVILSRHIEDKTTIYRSIFDPNGTVSEESISNYCNCPKIAHLTEELKTQIPTVKQGRNKRENEDITFDENLAYMLKLKKDTEAALDKGEIDKKDGLKILADITVKLNDKFNITEEVKDQVVIVQNKYTAVCEYCMHEIAPMPISKEDAMKMYNLVEDKSR